MAEHYKTRMAGSANPNYKNAGIKICPTCQHTFKSYGNHTYCSLECYTKSPAKNENSRQANDGRRKGDHPCKNCGASTSYTLTYCSDCWSNHRATFKGYPMRTYKICLNCGARTGKTYDAKFCKDCRSKGLHLKRPQSICTKCGAIVPIKNRKYCDACWHAEVRIKRGIPRKKDANQNEIVAALEDMGCSVIDASAIGSGFPDLIIGYNQRTLLFEIKNLKAKGKLNSRQKRFFDAWTGQADVIYTPEQAVDLVYYHCNDWLEIIAEIKKGMGQ